jgi:class 3 adenylate cyclase
MTTATATRRLAAIFAADVVGYSRLMGADEEGTHERFKAHLRELVDPKIRAHHGRIVKTTGDGVLAELTSVVDAVRCAVEIQRAMADRDLDLAEERRLRFRIGVNLGDVIADGGDIYGDGVNIAARLEALAAPGGVCVSGTVRDHIGDRLPYAFEDMGEQSIKNIARPGSGLCVAPRRHSRRADGKRAVHHVTFAACRCAAPVDRRPALYESQRRPGAAVFRGRDHRGPHDRSVAARECVCDLAQYRVHLPEKAGRHEAVSLSS